MTQSKPAPKTRKVRAQVTALPLQFTGLENRVEHLEEGQRQLSEKFDGMARSIFTKIDGLSSSLVGLQAQQPAKWGDVFAIVRDVAGIGVIVAGCIIYMAGNIYQTTAKDKAHSLELELTRVSARLSALEDVAKGRVVIGGATSMGQHVRPQS